MMKRPFSVAVSLFCAAFLPFSALAQENAASLVVLRPSDIAWAPAPPVLPRGAKSAVLAGNPGEAGPFTLRVRLPANYRVPSHWHSVAEYVTIISGSLCIATGERTDFRNGKCVGTGSFFITPAKLPHALWTRGPVEYELHAVGPFDGTYVNPADDPSRQRRP